MPTGGGGRGGNPSLSLRDVGAVKSKLVLTERALREALQLGRQLEGEKVRKQQILEGLLEDLVTVKNDQHELLLRAVEARLLVDVNTANKTELSQRTSASRVGSYAASGGVCVQDGALQHLRATKAQRLNEVRELEGMLSSLSAQSRQLEQDMAAFDAEASLLAYQAETCHAERERNETNVAILKNSVADALRAATY